MKAWVVLDEEDKLMEFCRNPWNEEGKEDKYCLCLGDYFTVFYTEFAAHASINCTKKFVKGDKPYNLVEMWCVSEWKIKQIEIPNLELT